MIHFIAPFSTATAQHTRNTNKVQRESPVWGEALCKNPDIHNRDLGLLRLLGAVCVCVYVFCFYLV